MVPLVPSTLAKPETRSLAAVAEVTRPVMIRVRRDIVSVYCVKSKNRENSVRLLIAEK